MAVINYEECEHNGTKLIREEEKKQKKAYEKKVQKWAKNQVHMHTKKKKT